MADEYEPAIEMASTETGAESAPIERADAGGPVADEPQGAEPRGARVISDKVRAMFRDIAAKHADKPGEPAGISDDLVPMEHESPPAPAGAPAAGAAAAASPAQPPPVPAGATAAPVPAPVVQPDVGRVAEQQARPIQEMRDRERAELDAKYAEREKQIEAREKQLPSRTDLLERPGQTIANLIREAYGVASDDELRDAMTDIVTELSMQGLGVKVPDDVRTQLEARKAVRSVKAYKADLTRQERELAEKRAAQEKEAAAKREAQEAADNERRAVAQVTQLVDGAKDTYKFLHTQDDPAAIVVEVIKEQLRQGQRADWAAAAKFADDYYRSEAEAAVKRADHLRSLLAPAAPAAPAKAAPSPGGQPGPSPKTQPTPAPATEPKPDEDEPQFVDWREARRQRIRASIAKTKGAHA